MSWRKATAPLAGIVCASVLAMVGIGDAGVSAQQAGGGGGRGGVGPGLFAAADTNKDGSLTREELKATFDAWFTTWDSGKTGALTEDQLAAGLSAALPQPAFGGDRPAAQNQTPKQSDVDAMMAALPEKAPAKPQRPRKVLVLGKAAGYVHSSIPLAAKTVEALGTKTGRLGDHHHVRFGGHQRAEPETIRRDLPREHHRRVSWTIPTTPRQRRRGGRRCSNSCAAARGWPAFTPPAIRTMRAAARRPVVAGVAAAGRPGSSHPRCYRKATRTTTRSSVARSWPCSPTRGSTRSIPTRPARSRKRTSRRASRRR